MITVITTFAVNWKVIPEIYNYEDESLSSMGYQKVEFDEESEELVNVEEDMELEEDFDESEFAETFDE